MTTSERRALIVRAAEAQPVTIPLMVEVLRAPRCMVYRDFAALVAEGRIVPWGTRPGKGKQRPVAQYAVPLGVEE